MRAITIKQPWAWAIFHGKDVENRSRNIAGSYRGPVAIHAGVSVEDLYDVHDARIAEALRSAQTSDRPTVGDHLDFGAIIGVADLVDVHTPEDCWAKDFQYVRDLWEGDRDRFNALPDSGAGGVAGKARLCSPWAQHNEGYHLVLADPRPCEPIPCRGALGLWTVPDDIAARLAGVP